MILFEESADEPLKIEPAFGNMSSLGPSYLQTAEQLLRAALPPDLFVHTHDFSLQLSKRLPIAHYNMEAIAPQHDLPVTFIAPAECTRGIGRYVTDVLTQWLVPGPELSVVGSMTLLFRFADHPATRYLLTHVLLHLETPNDAYIARIHLPQVMKELRLHAMAVSHARTITNIQYVPYLNQDQLIQLNIQSLMELPPNPSLFDEFHGIFVKMNAQKIADEVRRNVSALGADHPRIFHPKAFHEMAQYSDIFLDAFYRLEIRYLSRVLSYHYLLSKHLQEKIEEAPQTRHMSFKLLRPNPHTVGFLFGVTLFDEHEMLPTRHLEEAMRQCLSTLILVPRTLVINRKHNNLRLFYWEAAHEHGAPFAAPEIKLLRTQLPPLLLQKVGKPLHPIFLPRNEEEILRNLLLLCQQLRYVHDLPQVSIHYERQLDHHIIFSLALARILKPSTPPLQELLQPLPIEIDDIRHAGLLRKKYPKEAAICRITLDKTPFFRADGSVDLLRARQYIASELAQALGGLRDFNGGMILKQEEAFAPLCTACAPLTPYQETLLETYFYSLRPGIMQTVLDTALLKAHFQLLQRCLDAPETPYALLTERHGDYWLLFVKASRQALSYPASRDLASVSLDFGNDSYFGFITKMASFPLTLETALRAWAQEIVCIIPRESSS